MIAARLFSILRRASRNCVVLALASLPHPVSAGEPSGKLELTINDRATGAQVPARVEILGADGAYHVAEDAVRFVGDCAMSDPDTGFVDEAAALARFSNRIRFRNPYTKTTQFYSAGTSSVQLPAGPATVKIYRGPEYEVSVATVEIPNGAAVHHEIGLTRWVDMTKKGWYSADDHLHIARPTSELSPVVSTMMQAEDIHVANLL